MKTFVSTVALKNGSLIVHIADVFALSPAPLAPDMSSFSIDLSGAPGLSGWVYKVRAALE